MSVDNKYQKARVKRGGEDYSQGEACESQSSVSHGEQICSNYSQHHHPP